MSSALVRGDSTTQDSEENEKAVVQQRPTPRRDVLERYLIRLEKRPLLTRCLSYAVVGGLGALIGARSATPKHSRKPPKVDWLEVLSFTFYGGFVAGPFSHYWYEFLEHNFFDSQSQAMLIDQLIAQPPRLLLMFLFLDVSKSAMRAFPGAMNRSLSSLGEAVADSWRFWPISLYIMLRVLKKRKHYLAATMNLCSVAWMAQLAKRRSRGNS